MKAAVNFFTQEEQQRIEASVQAAEQLTSGEIVPMVVDASYEYPRAELIGAGTLALGCGLLVSWYWGGESIRWFVPAFLLTFVAVFVAIRSCPYLKRKLIQPVEMTMETQEKAIVSFFEQGLHETRDRTGILILISLFERRVVVLADTGINKVVPEHTWEQVVNTVVCGLKKGQACDALCQSISDCGKLLQENFPRKEDDTDELPNLILGEQNRI